MNNERIKKLKTLRTLFLILGIVLLVVGVAIPLITGSVLGYQAATQGITAENPAEFIKWEFSQPIYYVGVFFGAIFMPAGLALLIVRVAVITRKLNRLKKESETSNQE